MDRLFLYLGIYCHARLVLRQIHTALLMHSMPQRLVESVGEVFDPIATSAIAVFEHVKDKLAVIPCLLQATL